MPRRLASASAWPAPRGSAAWSTARWRPADRLRLVRHDEIQVELDDVAEAVARRARAKRVVEREQARLRVLVEEMASAALESFAELVTTGAGLGARTSTAKAAPPFAVGGLDRIGQPGCASASTDTRSTMTSRLARPPSAATSTSSSDTARPSTSRRRNPRWPGSQRLEERARSGRASPARRVRHLPVFQIRGQRRVGHPTTGISKPTSSRVPSGRLPDGARRPRRSRGSPRCRSCGRTCGRRAPRAGACSRESRWSCHGRSRVADAVLLADRDGRADAIDRSTSGSPSARGTGGRRPTATRRSAAGPRHRSCRRRRPLPR